MNLSKTAFWDIDFDKLDYEKHSLFIMEKVFNYGTWDDYLEIIRYYGKSRIQQEIIQSAYLKKKVLSFCCSVFQLKIEDFQCYTQRLSNHQHWDY